LIHSFKNYLIEEEKTVYFTFGRMNPPTIGHEKLLDVLARKAGKNPYRVFLSQSQDSKKNPLNYAEKIKYARKMFPKHARSIMLNKKVKTVFNAIQKLYDEGYKNVVMVVGQDRVREFDILLNKYNKKKGPHGIYSFSRINVVSAGSRDPDSEGVEGMSASKMRAAAADKDFTAFSQGLPKTISNADAKGLYNKIRSAMGLKEQREFKNHVQLKSVSDLRETYIKGNLYKLDDQVVIKETDQIATIKHLGANYVIVEVNNMQFRKWIDQIELLEKTTSPQDPDIKDRKGTQPAAYHGRDAKGKEMSKSTKAARDRHFKRGSKMDDDNPRAYKKAPGDAGAKTKPSKHTIRFKQMFGEQERVNLAKAKIDREKERDKIKHDRMMDRARLRDVQIKNRETNPRKKND